MKFLSLLSLNFFLFLSFFLSLSLWLLFFLLFFPLVPPLSPLCFTDELADCNGAWVNRSSVLVAVGRAALAGVG